MQHTCKHTADLSPGESIWGGTHTVPTPIDYNERDRRRAHEHILGEALKAAALTGDTERLRLAAVVYGEAFRALEAAE